MIQHSVKTLFHIFVALSLTSTAYAQFGGPSLPNVSNAETATELAADPVDCSVNEFAQAIAANGDLTCNTITDSDVPNDITIDLASAATELASDPTDCGDNQFASRIDTFGNLACESLTDEDIPDSLTITGGSISGITDLAVEDGGTGSSNATDARSALSAAILGVNNDITSLTSLTGPTIWTVGSVPVATNYSIQRNNDGTDLLQLNVPTGASFEFSVNDTSVFTVNSTVINALNRMLNNVASSTYNGAITWNNGAVITSGSYQVSRDTDATNQLHFNVPTGASFEFSVNDVPQALLSSSGLTLTTDLAITEGGTGASNASNARTNLGFSDGTYTPTITDVTNVAGHGSVSAATYMQVGNTVSVSGRIAIDPTSASISTELGISLPIASNFTLFADLGGTACAVDSMSLCAAIRADTTNDRASLIYVNTTETASREFAYHYQYRIK